MTNNKEEFRVSGEELVEKIKRFLKINISLRIIFKKERIIL